MSPMPIDGLSVDDAGRAVLDFLLQLDPVKEIPLDALERRRLVARAEAICNALKAQGGNASPLELKALCSEILKGDLEWTFGPKENGKPRVPHTFKGHSVPRLAATFTASLPPSTELLERGLTGAERIEIQGTPLGNVLVSR